MESLGAAAETVVEAELLRVLRGHGGHLVLRDLEHEGRRLHVVKHDVQLWPATALAIQTGQEQDTIVLIPFCRRSQI